MADAKDKEQKAKAAEPEAEKPKAAKAKAKAKKASKPKAEKAEAKAKAKDKAEAKADDKPAEDKPKRRGSAETGAKAKAKAQDVPTAPTNADGLVEVRAKAKFVRTAPRKARLVMDHIRGKSVADARAILAHTPRAAATDIKKVLESAIANAENNFELDPGDLRIHRATVDEGPTIKRFRPRALGRATPIHKRTSHMTITLTTGDGAGRADTRKARK
jgi:ribosomal protein L22